MGISKAQRNAETVEHAHIVAACNANPRHRCPLCGLTLAEARAAGMARPDWEAGHPEPGVSTAKTGWHGSCNRSHGAAKGNRQRGTGYSWP